MQVESSPVKWRRGSSTHSDQPYLPPMGGFLNLHRNTCKQRGIHNGVKGTDIVWCNCNCALKKFPGRCPKVRLPRWKSEPATKQKIKRTDVAPGSDQGGGIIEIKWEEEPRKRECIDFLPFCLTSDKNCVESIGNAHVYCWRLYAVKLFYLKDVFSDDMTDPVFLKSFTFPSLCEITPSKLPPFNLLSLTAI